MLALNSVAQQTPDESLDEEGLQTRLVLKFAPLSLLDFYSALQMALEYRVGKVSSIQVEGGYVLPLLPKDTGYEKNFRDIHGYRLRAEYRYYFELNRDETGGAYFAPEIMFLRVNYDRTGTYGINISGLPGYDYYQQLDYEVFKDVLAYHLKAGYQKKVTDFLLLDFYGGLGARHVFIDSNRPGMMGEGKVIKEETLFHNIYDKGTFYRISASLGFKIGFLLK